MSKIKLVLTDIDGTVVWYGKHNPSPAVKAAIAAVQAAGVELTAATGRPYEMMHQLFEELGFKGLGIFDAGASIRDIKSGELQWNNWLDPERIHAILDLLLPHAKVIDYFPDFRQVKPSRVSRAEVVAAPYVFALVDNAVRQKVIEGLELIPSLTYHIGSARQDRPDVFDIQITDINSDKYHAVNALRQLVHSDKDQTLAIGDSSNDLPLFKNAGIKVAMGNAIDQVKAEADYIVGDVSHDGFAEAMYKFVLY